MRRSLGVIAAVALLATVLLVLAASVSWESPELGRRILARATRSSGVTLTAERFRLSLLRGLWLEDLRATTELPGGRLKARADRLVFEHRLAPLLRGEFRVERILIERPSLELGERQEPPGSRGGQASGSSPGSPSDTAALSRKERERSRRRLGLVLNVEELRLLDGTLILPGEKGQPPTELRGLDLDLRDLSLDPEGSSTLRTLVAGGVIRAEQVTLGSRRLSDLSGGLRLSDGHARIEGATFRTAGGEFVVGDLDVDLDRSPFSYTFFLEGDPLDTHDLLGIDGRGLGASRLELRAAGLGAQTVDLGGEGRLTVGSGSLPKVPVLVKLETVLGTAFFVDAEYEAFEARFSLRRGRIELEPFGIDAGIVALRLSGWIGLDGPLALEVSVRAPRERLKIQEIPDEVLTVLTDSEGSVEVPLRIAGTRENPTVEADRQRLLQSARSRGRERLEERLEAEARERLRRLFGKKGN